MERDLLAVWFRALVAHGSGNRHAGSALAALQKPNVCAGQLSLCQHISMPLTRLVSGRQPALRRRLPLGRRIQLGLQSALLLQQHQRRHKGRCVAGSARAAACSSERMQQQAVLASILLASICSCKPPSSRRLYLYHPTRTSAAASSSCAC